MDDALSTEPVLRRMGLQDLDWVAAEHRRHFPDGFFARLGPRFLRRYYRTFLDGPTAVALVVEDEGRPQGYLVGVLSPSLHRRLLLDFHGRSLAASGLVGLLRRPRLAWVFVSTRAGQYLRALRPSPGGGSDDGSGRWRSQESPAVLSHLVVEASARGQGLGDTLLEAFVDAARSSGRRRAVLVTEPGSRGAGEFYRERGWRHLESQRTREGRRLEVHERDLRVAVRG